MTISAISNNLQPFQNTNLQKPTNLQNNLQQFQQQFQQLGTDLQSGNLSAAQTDLTSLQQLGGPGLSTSNPNNPISQSFSQLSEQLQSGNISGAEQDYSSLKQDFQSIDAHFHHKPGVSGSPATPVMGNPATPANGSPSNPIMGSLLQDLQSSTAQQAYSGLQLNMLQPFGAGGLAAEAAQTALNGISLMV